MPVALGVNGGVLGSNNLPTATTFRGVFTPNEVARAIALGFWPVNKSQAVTGVAGSGALGTLTVGATPDPYFEYTTLLLPGNGTNGAQNNTFLDGSTNNFTITRNGNTTQGTFSPFSQTGWGNYFSGVSDFLSYSTITLGASFTIEFFVYFPTTPSANAVIISNIGAGGTNWVGVSNTAISLSYSAGTRTFSFTPAGGTWYYVQIINSSSSLTCYVNGSQIGTSQTGPSSFTLDRIAGYTNVGFTGYLSNVRVNSTALAVSALPTSPLTNVANTVLLTCQSNRFVDNSGSPLTLTRGGSVSVQAFSPFNPTASWSAATNGGSGYFDGNGDSVNAASNAAFAIGTGDFTIEAWIYPISFGTYAYVFGVPVTGGLVFSKEATNFVIRAFNVGDQLQYATLPALNTWTHVAASRSGTTLRMFYNGVQVASTTNSYNFAQGAAYIGNENTNAAPWNGYISNFRLVKGTAVYTGNFTPPTAPITDAGSTSAASYPSTTNVNTSFASSATSLLLNFTNAGVYDATSKNDLETVGNAQISTAISAKWGSGSIYLNGTNSRFNFSPANLFILGTAAFTFETWFYPVAAGGSGTIFTCKLSGGRGFYLVWSTGSVLRLLVNAGTNWNVDISSSALTLNTWHHIAVTRSGSTFYLLADGSLANSQGGVSGEICSTVPIVKIGSDDANGSLMTQSYLQDTRFTNGIARYTGAYTVPTAAFPTL